MDTNSKWFGVAAIAAAFVVPSIIDHVVNGKLRNEFLAEMKGLAETTKAELDAAAKK